MRFSDRVFPFLFLILGGVVGGQSLTLVYSTNPQYPPFDWAVGDSVFAGASIDLLELVLPPEVKTKALVVPWKRAMEMAKAGQVDLLLSLRITPERSEYLEFTTHRAFPNPIVVFARADLGLKFTSWAALKGHPGGVSLGDTFGGGFDEYWPKELEVETADSMVENFRKLVAGRIDWFVTGKSLGQAYLASHRLPVALEILDPPISTGDIHFGFSRTSPWLSLVPEVSRRLAELDAAGVPEQLLQKHIKLLTASPTGRFPGE